MLRMKVRITNQAINTSYAFSTKWQVDIVRWHHSSFRFHYKYNWRHLHLFTCCFSIIKKTHFVTTFIDVAAFIVKQVLLIMMFACVVCCYRCHCYIKNLACTYCVWLFQTMQTSLLAVVLIMPFYWFVLCQSSYCYYATPTHDFVMQSTLL